MKTITTTVEIGPDRVLTVQLPPDVPTGKHDVVVVVNGVPAAPAPVLGPPYPVGPVDPTNTFRREDIYGDDGR
jgi:hypothetical protein